MDERQAYIEKVNARLSEWKARVDLLRAQAREAKADAKIEYSREADDLQAKLESVRTKVNELKDSSQDSWDELRNGVQKAYEDLGDAIARAMKH